MIKRPSSTTESANARGPADAVKPKLHKTRRYPSLRGNRMAAGREHFRDARGSKAGFRRALRSTQSSPTCTHNDHIERMIGKFICAPWAHILTPIALSAYAELQQLRCGECGFGLNRMLRNIVHLSLSEWFGPHMAPT